MRKVNPTKTLTNTTMVIRVLRLFEENLWRESKAILYAINKRGKMVLCCGVNGRKVTGWFII